MCKKQKRRKEDGAPAPRKFTKHHQRIAHDIGLFCPWRTRRFIVLFLEFPSEAIRLVLMHVTIKELLRGKNMPPLLRIVQGEYVRAILI